MPTYRASVLLNDFPDGSNIRPGPRASAQGKGKEAEEKNGLTGDLNIGDNYQRKGKLKLQVKTNSEIVLSSISEAHMFWSSRVSNGVMNMRIFRNTGVGQS